MIILNNTNVYIQETEVFAAYKHLFGFKKEKKQYTTIQPQLSEKHQFPDQT